MALSEDLAKRYRERLRTNEARFFETGDLTYMYRAIAIGEILNRYNQEPGQ